MHQFTDTQGRTWQIALTIGSALQVKAALQVDLLRPEEGDPPLFSRLGTDEYLLASVICELLRKQMEGYSLTEADVQAGFDGATLLAAAEAFWDELAGFSQSRGRTDRSTAVRKQNAVLRAAIKAAEAKVEAYPLTIPGEASGTSPG